jgi:hypothetical protein
MDCVLGYHLNPMSCGIAKFNQQLARELGVPLLSLFAPEARQFSEPLLSVKTTEFSPADLSRLQNFLDTLVPGVSLRLFLHAYVDTDLERSLAARAELIYCANQKLQQQLSAQADKLVLAWCPGTLLDATLFLPTEISVLSFGMAHKLHAEHYHKLDRLLRATGKSYCLYLSTALHEGTCLEENFLDVLDEMQQMFSGEVYFLGFLSDTAMYNYLRDSTYFAAFFPDGVRANNTSVHTAMAQGAAVITNLDGHSPPRYRHLDSVIDITACDQLPTDAAELARIGANARRAAQEQGWNRLIRLLQERERST